MSRVMKGIADIEQLKRQWLAMIDAIHDPLVLMESASWRIVRQNQSYADRSALFSDLKTLPGKSCWEVFAGRSSPCPDCRLQELAQNPEKESLRWETTQLFPGRQFEVEVHALRDLSGLEGLFVVHYRDVTSLHNLHEGLARAERMVALGTLSSGIAHEINSPLAGILAFAQLLKDELPRESRSWEDVVQIEEAAQKCKLIVESLLRFAHNDKAQDRAHVPAQDLITSSLRLMTPLLRKKKVALDLQAPDEPLWVEVNAARIGQVFLNLMNNALHAIRDCEEPEIQVGVHHEGENVHIDVTDNGTGIDPGVLPRIFDPFFTTKPVGEGTGLGLAISYSIVQQHGGDLRVHSIPGAGSTFTLILPWRPRD